MMTRQRLVSIAVQDGAQVRKHLRVVLEHTHCVDKIQMKLDRDQEFEVVGVDAHSLVVNLLSKEAVTVAGRHTATLGLGLSAIDISYKDRRDTSFSKDTKHRPCTAVPSETPQASHAISGSHRRGVARPRGTAPRCVCCFVCSACSSTRWDTGRCLHQ